MSIFYDTLWLGGKMCSAGNTELSILFQFIPKQYLATPHRQNTQHTVIIFNINKIKSSGLLCMRFALNLELPTNEGWSG